VHAALAALDLVVVQDLFVNETAKFAHVLLPGTSFLRGRHLHQRERRINRVRPVMASRTGKQEWQIVSEIAQAMGYPMRYESSAADHGRDRADHADLRRGVVRAPGQGGQRAVAVQRGGAERQRRSCTWTGSSGAGRFVQTTYVPTKERSTRKFPLILTTGRILSHYNVGAQTRRTAKRGLAPGGPAGDPSARRRGAWHQRRRPGLAGQPGGAHHAARDHRRADAGGRRLHHFHHPVTGANVVTTEHSDWATNCPEYKVTAVQVARLPSR